MPFEIGPGFTITVKGYNLLQKAAATKNCWIYEGGETPQVVVGESAKTEEATGQLVTKVDIKKAYKFGGTQVLFTPEEQKEMRKFGSPGIRIIGFKPQSMLPFWASVNKSTFIYPSEADYVGSSRVFSALWQKLLKDKIMGLAWYIARSNATPILVAILPSEERLSESNVQLIPAGLWLYPLPFADDLRGPPELPTPIPSPENLTDEMRTIVRQLQLPKARYDPSKYPNPSLQWFYRILQAMALDEDIPENPDDKTLPKYRQIDKRAGEYINNWGRILEEVSQNYKQERMSSGLGIKRGSHDSEDPPKKKIKVESLESATVDDLRKMIRDEKLAKHSMVELKGFLQSKGLAISGKKQELIDRVEQWVEDN
jgi:ATP-dependent DNA helicase 2 subunit 1